MGWDWVGQIVVVATIFVVVGMVMRRRGRASIARFEQEPSTDARLRVTARRASPGRVARGGDWHDGWLVDGDQGGLRFRRRWRRSGGFEMTQVVAVTWRRSTWTDNFLRGVEGIIEVDLGPDGLVELGIGEWTTESAVRGILRARGLLPPSADQHR